MTRLEQLLNAMEPYVDSISFMTVGDWVVGRICPIGVRDKNPSDVYFICPGKDCQKCWNTEVPTE